MQYLLVALIELQCLVQMVRSSARGLLVRVLPLLTQEQLQVEDRVDVVLKIHEVRLVKLGLICHGIAVNPLLLSEQMAIVSLSLALF